MVTFSHKFLASRLQAKLFMTSFILMGIFISPSIYGQHLEVPVKVDIENGSTNDILIKVMKNGETTFTQSSVSKLKLRLDFNSVYSIVFIKEGYITKIVEVDTKVPDERSKDGFEPYKIGVKLFKQYDGVNIAVYNQPVGKVHFDSNLDEFSYDTDYSKSILSDLQETEAKLAEKAKEEKEKQAAPTVAAKAPTPIKTETVTPPAPITTSASNTKVPEPEIPIVKEPVAAVVKTDSVIQKPIVVGADVAVKTNGSGGAQTKDYLAMEGENDIGSATVKKEDNAPTPLVNDRKEEIVSVPKPVQPRAVIKEESGSGEDAKSRPAANANMDPKKPAYSNSGNDVRGESYGNGGNDVPKIILPHIGNDAGNGTLNADGEQIIRLDIVEKNRTITLVKIIRGTTSIEYRRVNYPWGGPFYFVNDIKSISGNVFAQVTGVSD